MHLLTLKLRATPLILQSQAVAATHRYGRTDPLSLVLKCAVSRFMLCEMHHDFLAG
jgi:hypothetical protein